jgi:uncharacterized membrane protein YeaQ/YmgE (transglycosylase-associated protein family)
MNFISWIILGGIAGAIAKLIMPGKDPGGIIVTILLGIAGAFVGGFISTQIGYGTVTGAFHLGSIIIATGGAIIILLIYRMIKK